MLDFGASEREGANDGVLVLVVGKSVVVVAVAAEEGANEGFCELLMLLGEIVGEAEGEAVGGLGGA